MSRGRAGRLSSGTGQTWGVSRSWVLQRIGNALAIVEALPLAWRSQTGPHDARGVKEGVRLDPGSSQYQCVRHECTACPRVAHA